MSSILSRRAGTNAQLRSLPMRQRELKEHLLQFGGHPDGKAHGVVIVKARDAKSFVPVEEEKDE